MEPYHLVRIVEDTCFLQGLYIAPVAVLSLDVIRLEHSGNTTVPSIQEILCDQISAPAIVHQHLGLVLHLVEAALNKHIRNSVAFELLIQMQMSAADLAFTGFDDDPVDILLQQFLQTSGLLAPGVSCIFQ